MVVNDGQGLEKIGVGSSIRILDNKCFAIHFMLQNPHRNQLVHLGPHDSDL